MVQRIAATLKAKPTLTRGALSRGRCEWLDWRSPVGRPCEVGCRKALVELDRRGVLRLPARQEVASFAPQSTKRRPAPEVAQVRCRLEELGAVTVEPVTSRQGKSPRSGTVRWMRTTPWAQDRRAGRSSDIWCPASGTGGSRR